MEEAEAAEAAIRARSPESGAPGSQSPSLEPIEKSPVYNSYNTSDYKPN